MGKPWNRKQVMLLTCIFLVAGILSACASISGNSTPTAELTPTPTLQALVYEPTNPAGFDFPFNLLNITLTCPSAGNYLLEFDYLPTNTIIDTISDPNNPATSLTCAFRTAGHGMCSGTIDFGTLGVVSLQVCQGKSTLTRVCISQSVRPAACSVTP